MDEQAFTHKKKQVLQRLLAGAPVLFALLYFPTPTSAQTITAQENYDPYIRGRTNVATIDENTAFGDKTDFNSGATSFYVTVASIPGNNTLEVALRYKYVRDRMFTTPSWHWERDDPYISGDFPTDTGWVLGESTYPTALRSTARCTGTNLGSGAFMPPVVPPEGGKAGRWYPSEYYNGINLVLPRGGGGMLTPALGGVLAVTPPSQGGPYKWATNDGWIFSCIPLQNGPGEGFLGLAPDGTKYYFDDFRIGQDLPTLNKLNAGDKDIDLPRQELRIYASRIEDRFGNYVEGLSASDGRMITTADLGGGALRVNVGDQEWTVTNIGSFMNMGSFTIANPDGSQWKMISNWSGMYRLSPTKGDGPGQSCSPNRMPVEFAGTATATVTIPSGASATFDFAPIQRGYSYVPLSCNVPEGSVYNAPFFVDPSIVTEISLTKKTVSGPGMATKWTQISYGPPNDCFAWGTGSGVCTSTSPTTNTTKLTRSDRTYTTYTFGNRASVNQGQLLKTEIGVDAGAPMSVTNQQWQLFPPISDGSPGLSSFVASLSVLKRMTVIKRDVIQDGQRFTWEIASNCGSGSDICVDQFIRPTKVVKSSASTP